MISLFVEGRAFSPPERAKFSLDVMSDSEMSHSLSASAALPSIVETHHTPTEEAPTDASVRYQIECSAELMSSFTLYYRATALKL